MSTPKPSAPDAFPTIDPTALSTVSGGSGSSSSTDDAMMTALTGIIDSLQSIAAQPRGNDMSQLMMFMMAMNMGGGSQPACAPCAPTPTAYNWENGVLTPVY